MDYVMMKERARVERLDQGLWGGKGDRIGGNCEYVFGWGIYR